MLKIYSCVNICLYGKCKELEKIFAHRDCVYHKGFLYKMCADKPCCTVFAFSALDFVRNFEKYAPIVSQTQNTVLIITEKRNLKKFGIFIDTKVLSASLSSPVLYSVKPFHRFLNAVHTSCNTISPCDTDYKKLGDICIKSKHFGKYR